MRLVNVDSYWRLYGKNWGIRMFPRCASTSLSEVIGRGESYGEFMARPNKLCIVRDPWKRFLSVFHGMAKVSGRFESYGIRKTKDINEFIDWVTDQDWQTMDPHICPMHKFLEGMWEPEDHQIITVESYAWRPPEGLPCFLNHFNKTSYPQNDDILHVKFGMAEKWWDFYGADVDLWHRAQKSPLEAGGKQATDERP